MRLLEFFDLINEEALIEARIDFLRDKFEEPLQVLGKKDPASARLPNVFNFLAQNDPSKNKQFLQWMINLVIRGLMKIEDAPKAKDYLAVFVKFKNKIPGPQRDINKYKSLPDLFQIVEPMMELTTQGEVNRELEAQMHSEENIDLVYNSPTMKVVIPKNKGASCYFGQNTQWCTAASQSNNMFDYYTKRGPLYIVLIKKENKRFQFHFETHSFMDETDRSVALIDIYTKYPEIRKVFGKKLDMIVAQENPDRIHDWTQDDEVASHAIRHQPKVIHNFDIHSSNMVMSAIGNDLKLADDLGVTELDEEVNIADNYRENGGMTPELLLTILKGLSGYNIEVHGYHPNEQAFIARHYATRAEFVENELGEESQYINRIMIGEETYEVHDISDDAPEQALDALTPQERVKIGTHILDKYKKDLYDPDDYDPSDSRDILRMVRETDDEEDFRSTFSSAAYRGVEMGEEESMFDDFIGYIENLEPEVDDYFEEAGISAFIKLGKSSDKPIDIMVAEEGMINIASQILNDENEDLDESWEEILTYPDYQVPYSGYEGFDSQAAAETIKDDFYELFKE